MNLAYVNSGGKPLSQEEGKVIALEACRAIREKQEQSRNRARSIQRHAPDRLSVEKAMAAVEARLVDAYWVLGRSTRSPGPRNPAQHGIAYMLERADKWAASVAGGGWLTTPPPPPPASSHEIDASDEALEWISLLDKMTGSIVAAGARSKQGDALRRVSWMRVRLQLPHCSSWSASKLHRTYKEGLRIIAAEVRHA